MSRFTPILVTLAVLAASAGVAVAQAPDAAALMSAEKDAMKPVVALSGVWRGPAWSMGAGGRHDVTQTERIGPLLDGTIEMFEGRSYNPDGSVPFNALGIVSYSPQTKKYSMHSYALGYAGDFPFTLTANGYIWEIPAGPGAVIRYTATVKDGSWREIGEHVVSGKQAVQIFEMNLRRVGDTDWPGANPPAMK